MYYKFDSRLIIQKPGGNKYYFQVVKATTDRIHPFSIPVASIEVIASSGNLNYLAPLRFDDIVRLQVSVRYSPNEKIVWQNLFEGRVLTIRGQYGKGSTATIICSGHEAETAYSIISEAKVYATATEAATILHYLADQYLSRTHLSIPSTTTGISVPYSTKMDQKYMKDIFLDFEKLSGYSWMFMAKPVYLQNGTLSSVPIEFKQFSTVPNPRYKVVQGTPRLLSAEFSSDGQNVYTKIIEYGQTPPAVAPATVGVQYKGSYLDTTAASKYGTRVVVETDTGFESNELCAAFAQFYLPQIKSPRVAGTVTLEGTPQACIGDRVATEIPMININGESLDPNYPVLRVHHEISFDSFETTLTLGETFKKGIEDYLVEFAKQNRLTLANFIS